MSKKKVYVSSTFEDLQEHRAALKQALERAQFDVESMERYPAFDRRPLDKCKEDVAACDYYVLLLGHRYGFVPEADNPERKSITHLEYDHARASKRHVLAFVVDEQVPWRKAFMDRGDAEARLAAFRAIVERDHGRATFGGPESLSSAVLQALRAADVQRPPAGQSGPFAPRLAVFPTNAPGMNVVRGVEDNDEPNGVFSFSLTLHLAPGERPVDLLGFSASYWANGCPALRRPQPALELAGAPAPLMGNVHSLVQPIRLPEAGLSLRYHCGLRPPLTTERPEDCDYGDVCIRMTYRVLGDDQLVEEEQSFRFEPGGRLARIDAVRPVPRLNDVELRRCREQGRITEQQLAAMLEIDPVDRYMGARSDVGENFVHSPTLLEILRAILRSPC